MKEVMRNTCQSLILLKLLLLSTVVAKEVKVGWYLGVSPLKIDVDVGDKVVWVWEDSLPHTIKGVGDASGLFKGDGGDHNLIQQLGFEYSHVFNESGTFPFECALFGGGQMTGVVSVALPPEAIEGSGDFIPLGDSPPPPVSEVKGSPKLRGSQFTPPPESSSEQSPPPPRRRRRSPPPPKRRRRSPSPPRISQKSSPPPRRSRRSPPPPRRSRKSPPPSRRRSRSPPPPRRRSRSSPPPPRRRSRSPPPPRTRRRSPPPPRRRTRSPPPPKRNRKSPPPRRTRSPPPKGGKTVKIQWYTGISKESASVTVPVGTTVEWVWADSAFHSVEDLDFSRNLFSGLGGGFNFQGPPFTYKYKFNTPGEYPYDCAAHGTSMAGTITVTKA